VEIEDVGAEIGEMASEIIAPKLTVIMSDGQARRYEGPAIDSLN
jgi:hypothetical protein